MGLVLRAQYLDFSSWDTNLYFIPWLNVIRHDGILLAFRGIPAGTPNSPFYCYVLGLFNLVFPDLNALYLIKCITFCGEIVAARFAYLIVAMHYRDRPDSMAPCYAAAGLLLCPSVIANGSITGQCDIWTTMFLLGAIYAIMRRKSATAMLYGGLAYAYKGQAIFLVPYVGSLLLRRDLKWKTIWIVPAVYLAVCMPAWLEGRPMRELLTSYWYLWDMLLSFNIANPYMFIHMQPFAYSPDLPVYIRTGEIIAAVITGQIMLMNYRRWKGELTPFASVLMALLFACVMPYIMPLMHERYFFLADILSLLLACMRPRWFILPVLFQAASLTELANAPGMLPPLPGLAGWVQQLGLFTAFGLNTLAIGMVLWLCYRHIWNKGIKELRGAKGQNAPCETPDYTP